MMKRKIISVFATVLALAFVGCSHDTLTGDDSEGDQNGSKDAVYMNVTVQLPVAGGMGSRVKPILVKMMTMERVRTVSKLERIMKIPCIQFCWYWQKKKRIN